jgi:hypothetical protein
MFNDDSDKPIRRRDFFRRGLLEFFKPIDRAMEPIKRVAQQFDALDRGSEPSAPLAASPDGPPMAETGESADVPPDSSKPTDTA